MSSSGRATLELGYAEIVTNPAGVTSTTDVVIAGLALTSLVIPADRPVLVELYLPAVSNSTANAQVIGSIFNIPGNVTLGVVSYASATASAKGQLAFKKRFAAGVCPTDMQAYVRVSAGTATIQTAAAGFPNPYIQATAL